MAAGEAEMSFWDHLEVLRGTLFRSVLVITLVSVVVFCFKSLVFDDIILAPTKSDFFIYKWLRMGNMQMSLVNLDISAQFFVHLQVAFELGFILSFPYVCFEIWKFIAPALYRNEKRAVRGAFLSASFLFYLGLVIGYYLIVPISLNFFMGYKISDDVMNTISLTSYISMFTSTVLAFGIVFEFPIVVELGFILSFPYVCFEIWKFIAPALYRNEKRAVRGAFLSASFLFYLGLVIGYYLIVPISLNFFMGYKISDDVMNTISLTSYISMFTSTVLAFGIVFEFPIVVVILSKLGIVTRNTLIKYRRHAIVVILCIAAIITPADPMSMLIAAAPLLILYEVCVMCCKPARPEDALEEIKEEA